MTVVCSFFVPSVIHNGFFSVGDYRKNLTLTYPNLIFLQGVRGVRGLDGENEYFSSRTFFKFTFPSRLNSIVLYNLNY